MDDLPTIDHAHPGLALTPDLVGAGWYVFRARCSEIATEGGDARVAQRPALIDGAALYSEPRDFGMAMEVLASPRSVTQGVRAFPEHAVERRDIVADEGALIRLERGRELRDDLGSVDLGGADHDSGLSRFGRRRAALLGIGLRHVRA